MKDKIIAFLNNYFVEVIVSLAFFALAAINAVSVNAGSYSDLATWAKVCTDISMGIFGLMFIKAGVIPVVYALLKLLKIVK